MNEPDLQAAAINRHMYLAVTLPAIGPWIVSIASDASGRVDGTRSLGSIGLMAAHSWSCATAGGEQMQQTYVPVVDARSSWMPGRQ